MPGIRELSDGCTTVESVAERSDPPPKRRHSVGTLTATPHGVVSACASY